MSLSRYERAQHVVGATIRGCSDAYYILLDDSVQIAFAERPILPASEWRRVTVIAYGAWKISRNVRPGIFI